MKPLTQEEEIIPLYDRILVEIPEVAEKTSGGIILTDTMIDAKNRQECRAKILAMGPIAFADLEIENRPKIGDLVLIPRHAGKYYEAEGKTEYGLRLIRPGEALAIVRRKT
jgi:co-chaperonin GroES (HSP10)